MEKWRTEERDEGKKGERNMEKARRAEIIIAKAKKPTGRNYEKKPEGLKLL